MILSSNISANSKTDATKSTSDANIEVGYADDMSLKIDSIVK